MRALQVYGKRCVPGFEGIIPPLRYSLTVKNISRHQTSLLLLGLLAWAALGWILIIRIVDRFPRAIVLLLRNKVSLYCFIRVTAIISLYFVGDFPKFRVLEPLYELLYETRAARPTLQSVKPWQELDVGKHLFLESASCASTRWTRDSICSLSKPVPALRAPR